MSYKFSLKLNILTPTIIANGNIISPIEYIIVNKRYYRMSEKVYEKILDKYSTNLNRSIYQLLNGKIDPYIFNILKKHAKEYSIYSMPIDTSKTEGTIIEHFKNYNYTTIIPSSTIKGFIRTSLLYYMLKKNVNLLIKACNRIEETLSEINTSLLLGNFYRARREAKRVSEEIEKMVFRVGNADILKNLRIFLNKVNNLENVLSELKVINRNNKQTISQQLAEFIRKGSFEYIALVNIDKYKIYNEDDIEQYNLYIEKTRKMLDKDTLFDALKTYSRDIFDYEKDLLKEIYNNVDNFERFFNKRSFVIRIGFGSGHLWKTIILLLIKNNKSLYDKLKDTMSKLYGRTWNLISVKLYSGSIEVPLGFSSIFIEEVV